MNFEAQPLQHHEIEAMLSNDEVIDRVLESYRLMLDFYGMQLKSAETGLLARAEPERKYMERYRNLVRKCCDEAAGVESEELTTARLLA